MPTILLIVIILAAAAAAFFIKPIRRRIIEWLHPAQTVPMITKPTPAPVVASSHDADLQSAIIPAMFDLRGARAHIHDHITNEDFIFIDRKLVNDPANNPGHTFLGNALLVQDKTGLKRLLWWDSAADIGRSTQVLAVSMSNQTTPLEITYDQTCGLIIDVRLK